MGILTSLPKVNLVQGSMPKAKIRRVREREREEGHDWVDFTVAFIPDGPEMEALVSSAHKARKQALGEERTKTNASVRTTILTRGMRAMM